MPLIAAYLDAWGGDARIGPWQTRERRPGESLVAIAAATVGHLDLSVASGSFPVRPSLPYVPGVEGAGHVVASERFPTGTPVTIRGGGVGISRDGTWAEQAIVPDEALHPWPVGMSPGLAACYYVPATTAHVALHSVASVSDEDTVLVLGAGGAVGSLAVQLAARTGARVLAMASSRRALTLPHGVERVHGDDADALSELAATRSVTLLVDTVGGPALADRLWWVAPGGRIALIGYTYGSQASFDLPSWLMSDVAVLPVNTLTRTAAAAECAVALARELVDGSLVLDVTEFALSAVTDAIARLAEGSVQGRVVLVP